jgi:flavin-binding protein dodecin
MGGASCVYLADCQVLRLIDDRHMLLGQSCDGFQADAERRLARRASFFVIHHMEDRMAESVYKIVELVGTSTESFEKAINAAVERAAESLRDLRIAQVSELDVQIQDGKVQAYRVKVKVSFKYEG